MPGFQSDNFFTFLFFRFLVKIDINIDRINYGEAKPLICHLFIIIILRILINISI